MILTDDQITDIQAAALASHPNEFVGVCVDDAFITLTNVSDNPESNFQVDPEEYEAAIEGGTNICLIHSHPYDQNDDSEESAYIRQMGVDRRQPSKSDMATAQAMGIEFGIVCTEGETVSPVLFFNGEPADYTGRKFASGAFDCWQLVVDYFKIENNFDLPNAPRDFNWWYDAPELDLYSQLDSISELVEVDIRDIEHGDIILMSVGVDDDLINHSGIYINDQDHQAQVLHHLFGQLSSYGSYFRYQRYAKKVLRYVGEVSE